MHVRAGMDISPAAAPFAEAEGALGGDKLTPPSPPPELIPSPLGSVRSLLQRLLRPEPLQVAEPDSLPETELLFRAWCVVGPRNSAGITPSRLFRAAVSDALFDQCIRCGVTPFLPPFSPSLRSTEGRCVCRASRGAEGPLIPGHLRGERPPGCKAPGPPHLRGAVFLSSEFIQRVPHRGGAWGGINWTCSARTNPGSPGIWGGSVPRDVDDAAKPPPHLQRGAVPLLRIHAASTLQRGGLL